MPGVVKGSLAPTDDHSRLSDSSFADHYSFNGTAQQISILLTATGFDPYLYLFTTDNTLMTENNDATVIDLNSRIPPGSGTYIIEATSFSGSTIGAYTLVVTTPASAAPIVQFGGDSSGLSTGNYATLDNLAVHAL